MLASMEMAEELGDDQQSEDEAETRKTTSRRARSRARKAARTIPAARIRSPRTSESSTEDQQAGETEATDADSDDMADDDDADAETPGEAKRPEHPFAICPRRSTTRSSPEVRRDGRRRGALRRGGTRPLRAFLDKQLANLPGAVGRLANRLQRRLMAQQNRSWEFDLEEGYARPARLTRVVIDPMQALSFKGARHRFPRHGGDAAARQFRLDARPPDHGRGDLRRHPGAHAGALRRQGRDPRLHHPRLEGRQEREKWLKAGKPPNPGRLNDLRHIIYKAADEPWRRARRNLGLMMREGLLKENIDGEALLGRTSA
jgi:cobaltochelatase CobT